MVFDLADQLYYTLMLKICRRLDVKATTMCNFDENFIILSAKFAGKCRE